MIFTRKTIIYLLYKKIQINKYYKIINQLVNFILAILISISKYNLRLTDNHHVLKHALIKPEIFTLNKLFPLKIIKI